MENINWSIGDIIHYLGNEFNDGVFVSSQKRNIVGKLLITSGEIMREMHTVYPDSKYIANEVNIHNFDFKEELATYFGEELEIMYKMAKFNRISLEEFINFIIKKTLMVRLDYKLSDPNILVKNERNKLI